jgi:hypothetical protein
MQFNGQRKRGRVKLHWKQQVVVFLNDTIRPDNLTNKDTFCGFSILETGSASELHINNFNVFNVMLC